MTTRAFITGVSGLVLTADEVAFLRETKPWALILFARNVSTPEQVVALVAAFRAAVGQADAPVLIDQEGGRVQRLRQPHWAHYPPQDVFGQLFALDEAMGLRGAYLLGRLIGDDLIRLGITVDCTPCIDLYIEEAHKIIGNRAFSPYPAVIAALAKAKISGLLEAGVLPVIKHIPGHGRAMADSHEELPVVHTSRAELEASDFAPFRALNDAPLAMTAHVVYAAIDAAAPATTSKVMIGDVIRRWIGFDGALMSDDLSMKALAGDFADRARASFAAGCDLALHCNGDLTEARPVADASPVLAGDALRRVSAAMDLRTAHLKPFDRAAAEAEFVGLLEKVDAVASFLPATGGAYA